MTVAPVGAVLTGGASRRMGRPKAWITVDGVAMAERVATALEDAGCAPVFYVGMPPPAGSSVDTGRWRTVPDAHPGEGPVGGLVTALAAAAEHTPGAGVVVAACDLPWLEAAGVASLLRVVDGRRDVDVVAARSQGHHVPVAVWQPRAHERIAELFADGERSWRGVLAGLRVVTVELPARTAVDVDAPDDLPRDDLPRDDLPRPADPR